MNWDDLKFHLETVGLVCGTILVVGLFGMLIAGVLP
jgi:hypothetical protein